MNQNSDLSDEELMSLYQLGQERAFTILYQRYSNRVYGYLRQRLATDSVDDAFQAVFIKLHRSREQFNSSFTFAPWLFAIARTVTLDWHKKQNAEAKYIGLTEIDTDSLAAQTPETVNLKEVDLSILPKPQRNVIEMRYFQDLSFDEIAKRLETSPGNVRQLVSRGLRLLRSYFAKAGS